MNHLIPVPAWLLHALAGPGPSEDVRNRAFLLWLEHQRPPPISLLAAIHPKATP